MPSKSHASFAENKADIDRLWEIHQEVAGAGRGRKHDVDVLNRSAIVLITACWEAYVEDVAMEAFDFLLKNAPSAACIPKKVKADAIKGTLDAKDPAVRVWTLADAGWKDVLGKHRDATKQKWVDSLHTPRTAQVDDLFERLLGLRSLHACWSWGPTKPDKNSKKLDAYITVRGQIAHRLNHDTTVRKDRGTDYLRHVVRLVDKTDARVRDHLTKTVGKTPW